MSLSNIIRKKVILFDLDGCLLDTSLGIKESVIYTLNQLELPMPSRHAINHFIGPPIQDSLKYYCGLDDVQAQVGAEIFRNYYKNTALFKADVYNGIFDMLARLKTQNRLIGVATYKREDYAITLLDKFNLSGYCSVVHGADNFNQLTKSDIIRLCLNDLSCTVNDAIMIGDTIHDALAASEVGMDFIGVTWGFGFKSNEYYNNITSIGFAKYPLDILSILKGAEDFAS